MILEAICGSGLGLFVNLCRAIYEIYTMASWSLIVRAR